MRVMIRIPEAVQGLLVAQAEKSGKDLPEYVNDLVTAQVFEPMTPVIHDRGRGPEIKGTRITVYDVFDCHSLGWTPEAIANEFQLTVPEAKVAIDYIEANRPQVEADYATIVARSERGNPPELQAKIDANRESVHRQFAAIRERESK